MILLKKTLSVAAILTIALAFSFSRLPKAHSEELSLKDKSLAFITNVVGLDMTKYNVTHVGEDTLVPSGTVGIVNDMTNHILEYNGSKLAIMCIHRNGSLVSYNLDRLNGSILTAQPPAENALESAKTFLQNYTAYLQQAPYLQPMNDLLSSLPDLQNMTQYSGNIKLSVSVTGTYVKLKFMDSFMGLDDPWKAVVLNINNGILVGLGDGWNVYQMGSTNVSVSSSDAVNIAMNRAGNYSLQFYDGPGGTLISVPFSISVSRTETQLSIQARDGTTLYPFWYIQLYFDKWIHSTFGIEAGIWADNGQVLFFQPTGYVGTVNDGGKPQPNIQPTPTPTDAPILTSTSTPTQSPTSSPSPSISPSPSPSSTALQLPAQSPEAKASSALPMELIYLTATLAAAIIAASSVVLWKRRNGKTLKTAVLVGEPFCSSRRAKSNSRLKLIVTKHE